MSDIFGEDELTPLGVKRRQEKDQWDKGLITDRTDTNLEQCFCIGPQEGQQFCPCALRYRREYLDLVEELPLSERRKMLYGDWRNDVQ
tara:strand:- start:90 stop:353 length:264 start_codon:yes stop_codon:yes gene_type:complete